MAKQPGATFQSVLGLGRQSIRVQLASLVLAITLPAFALAIWHLVEERERDRQVALERVKTQADNVAERLLFELSDNAKVLELIASQPRVREMTPGDCDPLIADYVRLHPEFVTIGIRDLQGTPVCSFRPVPPSAQSMREYPWFAQALQAQGFRASDLFLAPIAQRWVTVLSTPVRDAAGATTGLVVLPLDLLTLNQTLLGRVPDRTLVTVVDREFNIILRSADAAAWLGKPASEQLRAAMQGRPEGFAVAAGTSGVRRIHAYQQLPGTGWSVFAGMPEAEVFAAADAALRNSVLVCVLLLLLSLWLSWRLARGLVQPMEALATTARRVAQGDTLARVPPVEGATELRDVSQAFNHMLDEQERARGALRESEENLATTLQSIGDAVIVTDVSGIVTRLNPAAERLTGWSSADGVGRAMSEVFHIVSAGTREVPVSPVQQVLESGEVVGLANHTLLLSRDGREYQISDSAAPIRNGAGNIVGVVLVFSDVTAQYAAQQELREAYNFSRQIIDSLPLGINVRDREGRYLEWNPVMADMTGRPATSTLGRTLAQTVDGELSAGQQAALAAVARAMNGETVLRHDVRMTYGGRVRWVEGSYAPIRDTDGAVVGVVATLQDITARNLAQTALRQSERNLGITLQSIGDAVITTDAQGLVTRMNPVAEQLTGWSLQDALGEPLGSVFRVIDSQSRQTMADPVQQVLASGEASGRSGQVLLLAREGSECPISDNAAPIREDGEIVGVVLVFSDISAQYEAQHALREAYNFSRQIIDNLPLGLNVIDSQGRYLEWNRGMALFRHHNRDDMLGRHIADNYPRGPQNNYDEVMDAIARSQRGETVVRQDTPIAGTDPLVWATVTHAPLRDSDGQVVGSISIVQDVTARKLAQESLRASEENLAITLQSIGDAVIATDAQGRITRMNAAAERLTGWPMTEALGQPLLQVFRIVHTRTRETPDDPVTMVLRTGDVVGLANHTSLLARGGAEFQIADSAAPIRNSQGDIVGVVLVFSDVTEQYRLQQVLVESEGRFRALVESSPVGVVVHQQHKLVFANPAAVKALGAGSADELTGRPVGDFVHPDHHARLQQRARDVESDPGSLSMAEWRYLRIDGSPFDVQAQASVIQVGGMPAVQVTFIDITQRKLAEERLRDNEARFRALTSLSSDWYWEQDAQHRFIGAGGDQEAWSLSADTSFLGDAYIGKKRWELGETSLTSAQWEQHRAVLDAHQEFRDLEMRFEKPDGSFRWAAVSGTPIFDAQGTFRGYRGIGRDITAQKLAAEQIHALAFYDALTDLPNRRLLIEQLKRALVTHARTRRQAALLFIDLDNFKTLNDTLGHETGDQLLKQVAQRLLSCVREADSVARLGGDEFVVMLEDLSDDEFDAANDAEHVAHKILAAFAAPFLLAGREYRSSPSIGITLFGAGGQGVEDLLKQADLAMYQAKSAGRNTLRMFDQGMQAAVDERAALEADLREALVANQFELHYQPIVDASGMVSGVEALVRWHHPRRGLVAPEDFVPLAESTRLIIPLGLWVLDAACAQLAAWSANMNTELLTIAVNVSAYQFKEPGFVAQVLDALTRHGADARRLKLELTESLLADNIQDVIGKMTALRQHGVDFSLDDFGTGYSSLSYLKQLPLSHLKIDQSFVHDLLHDPNDAAIARTIVALGATLGLAVIAEGVEEQGQLQFLLDIGCDTFQGFLFGLPMPIGELEAVLPGPLPRPAAVPAAWQATADRA